MSTHFQSGKIFKYVANTVGGSSENRKQETGNINKRTETHKCQYMGHYHTTLHRMHLALESFVSRLECLILITFQADSRRMLTIIVDAWEHCWNFSTVLVCIF